MLTIILDFLRSLFLPMLYFGGMLNCLISIFKKAEWGLFLMVALIPQPNIFYKLYEYPLGKDFLDLLFASIFIGIFINKKGLIKTNNFIILILFIMVSYISLWNTSIRFSLPAPITIENILFVQWKNYAMMILMYFLALNAVKDEDQQKIMVLIVTLVILFISFRSYRGFTAGSSFIEESRSDGPFWRVGLGSNHFGAFIVDYCSILLGLFIYDKAKWRKILYIVTILFSLHPLFFSYSRGAYIAALGILIFFGVLKKRSLLILVIIIILAWGTLLPTSVVDRIKMTRTETGQLEHSAAVRFDLWDHAMKLFEQNPIFGVGFGGYGFTLPEEYHLKETHNYYLKTLSEQGIIGITFLLFILFIAFRSGYKLFKNAKTPFHKGLSFGFLGCIISSIITNMFGDRWSYFILGSYFWIFWGLVDGGIFISERERNSKGDI